MTKQISARERARRFLQSKAAKDPEPEPAQASLVPTSPTTYTPTYGYCAGNRVQGITTMTSTSYDPWLDWNNVYTTQATNYTTDVWHGWNASQYTLTGQDLITYADTSWKNWNSSYYTRYTRLTPTAWVDPRTPEQIAEDNARIEAHREASRVAAAARAEEVRFAAERAEKLLTDHLTPEQLLEWREKQQIHVSAQSGRRYCIKKGRAHNVFQVDASGRRIKELCGHVGEGVPNEDNVLAQKLAIEMMEERFLSTCNIWDLTVPHRPLINRSRGSLMDVA